MVVMGGITLAGVRVVKVHAHVVLYVVHHQDPDA